MKFTFKKQPRETGLRSVGNPYASVDIKHNKKVVGTIAAPNWMSKDGKWVVRFMQQDTETQWHWITLKTRFDDEAAARTFLVANADKIIAQIPLHHTEE